ncbi:GNAT family N-acetyltransferase [Humibacillus xanthopallidus]|uniref:GNAT family N-acetyltransferase n=1 Tax=Humibacillus xanthopallidus TaxID=412689 RepID=UPI00384EF848
MPAPLVRDATASDAAACAAIYAPYVTDTAVTFETEPPTVAEMVLRIEGAQRRHAWLVIELDGAIAGYAYAGPFKERAAYRWSCEVSVYLDPDHHGRGAGRLLYEALLTRLAKRGFRMAAAGMTQPNKASGRLHAALGFETVGTFRAVGWKHGAWRDVTWVQRPLAGALPDFGDPPEPV